MINYKYLLATAFLVVSAKSANAQTYEAHWPDEEPTITSAIMSRTSITVRSIEESLILYRDILGMTPFYVRTELRDPRLSSFSGLNADQYMNLTVLRTETDGPAKLNAGYLGLSEIRNADGTLADIAELPRNSAAIGAATLLIVAKDTKSIHEQVVEVGYEVISAPTERDDGTHSQLLMRGPNGERLWISEGELPTSFIRKIVREDEPPQIQTDQ